MTRWSMSGLLARVGKSLLTRRPRSPQPIRRVRLQIDPLEERIVLDAVAPGSWWDDGVWQNGVKVGVTVSLHNSGPGWLEVNRNGSGAVSVAPGTPPSGEGEFEEEMTIEYGPEPPGGGGSPEEPPTISAFAFSVYGYAGDGSGDVTWSGSADSLYVWATGDVSSISIGGSLYVQAGWTVGDLSAHTVSATAGRSIGNVSASDDIGTLTAGTSIGTVTAADAIWRVSAGGSLGDVTAGDHVTTISVGASTGSISAGGWLGSVSAGLDIGGSVSAGLWIGGAHVPGADPNDYWAWQYATYGGGIWAGRDIVGSVAAGKGIVGVSAGRHILGSVTANYGDVWWVRAGGGGVWTDAPDPDYPDYPGEGSWEPYAPGRIVGPVTASRDVHAVSATGDVEGAVTAQSGFVLGVNADGDIRGAVTAQTDVGRWVARDPENDWRPYGYYWGNPYWYGYGWHLPRGAGVQAGGAVDGAVTATEGDMTVVSAGAAITGVIEAGRDIGSVSARDDISGAITAGRDVSWVSAGGSGMEGYYWDDPYGETGPVASVAGAITAGRDINSVSASGDVTGAINAGHGIGGVTAGGNITSTITAGAAVGRLDDSDPRLPRHHPYWSNYDNPYWWGNGVQAGGDFTGSVTAGTDVSLVEAGGVVAGAIDASRDVGFVHGTGGVSAAITAGRDLGRVYAGGYGFTWSGWYSTWGEFSDAPLGDFTGTIDAAGDVYGVFATGDVSGPVTAGGGIADVSAKGSVTGDITAGASIGYLGELVPDDGDYGEEWYYGDERYFGGGIFAGVDVNAAVEAGGDITAVRAGRDIAGSITAGRDVGSARAARDLSGSITADRDIGALSAGRLQSYVYASGLLPAVTGDLTGTATAGRDIRSVTATGDIDATITAGHSIGGVYAQGDIGGAIKATSGAIGRLTDGPPPYNPYDPYESYRFPYSSEADAPGKVHADGSIDATITAGIDITQVEAGRDISGSITAGRDIGWVEAGFNAGGRLTATIDANRDIGHVTSFGAEGRSGRVTGVPTTHPLDVAKWDWFHPWGTDPARPDPVDTPDGGAIDGTVTAGRNIGPVTAFGPIGGAVDAAGTLGRVWALRNLTGSLTAGEGGITAESWGGITGDVNAPGDLHIWGYEDGAGTLTTAAGNVFAGAWADFDADVRAHGRGELFALDGMAGTSFASETDFVAAWAGKAFTPDVTGHTYAAVHAGNGVTATTIRAVTKSVWVESGADISVGTIKGYEEARVAAFGAIDAAVTAETGRADVWAEDSISGSVWAETDAEAMSERADVLAAVTARLGDAIAWAYGLISGSVTAGRDTDVRAKGDVSGSVTAGRDATVDSNATVSGKVDAFEVADVKGTVAVSGAIDGGLRVDVWSTGSVSGALTSIAGEVAVWTLGDVAGAIRAEGDIMVEAGGKVSGTITAGIDEARSDVTVVAKGSVSGAVSATGAVHLEAGGDVTSSSIRAKEDVFILAAGAVNSADIRAGWTASVSGLAGVAGGVSAVSTVAVEAHGSVSASLTSDSGYVTVWTSGDVTGTVVAGLDAIVNARGSVTGSVSAGGEDVWGTASVSAGGSVTGSVTGTWAADVIAWGRVDGIITGTDGYARVVSGGSFGGNVYAHSGHAEVWTWANARGRVTAEGDVTVVTFGLVSGSLTSEEGGVRVLALGEMARGDGIGDLSLLDSLITAALGTLLIGNPALPPGEPGTGDVREEAGLDHMLGADGPDGEEGVTPSYGWLELLDRSWKVIDWLSELPVEILQQLKDRWNEATDEEKEDFIRDLLKGAESLGQLGAALDNFLDPNPDPPVPPVNENPPKQSPSPDDLKRWEDEAKLEQVARDARVAVLIKERTDELDKRKKLRDAWLGKANQLMDARNTVWNHLWHRGEDIPASNEEKNLRFKADKVMDLKNFVVENGDVKPVTDLGQQQLDAWNKKLKEWEDIDRIQKMGAADRLGAAIQGALDRGLIQGEIKKQVEDLVKPENLAAMGGILTVVIGAQFTPVGPFVTSVVGVIGYVLTGKTAIEVTYDMYMFITTALGARTQQDIDKAGDRFAKGVGTLTVEGGTAAATLGAGALLGAVGPVAKAGKKPVKNRADGKVEVDIEVEVRGRMAEPPPARDGRKGVPAPDPSELAAALLTLRTKLKDVVGTKVLQHVADKLKADPAKELETLKALETMAGKIKEYKGGTKPARWVDTDEKVRALLTAVLVENKQLANLPVDELVRDLKDVSHLPSFVPALKQLVRDDPQLKGNLAEIVETAKDLRATPPKVVEDIAQRIEVKYRDPEDGRRVKTGHSDIDIISDGTLWQLKIGPTSLLTGPKFKLWLVKAIAAAKATGKTKIGFRFDPDAMNAYNKTDVYKDILKDLRKKNPDVEILDPVPIPNP